MYHDGCGGRRRRTGRRVGRVPAGTRRRARHDFRRLAPARKAVRRRRHRTRAVARPRRPSIDSRVRARVIRDGTVSRASQRRRPAIVPLDDGALEVTDRRGFDQRVARRGHPCRRHARARHASSTSTAAPSIAVRTRDATYAADFLIGADGANSLVRRRLGGAVHARATVDRDRLLRARRHERRDRHRDGWRSAGIFLVVSSHRSSRGRRLRPGGRRYPVRTTLRATRRRSGWTRRGSTPPASPARLVFMADPVARARRLLTPGRLRDRAGASWAMRRGSSIRSRAKGSTLPSRPASGPRLPSRSDGMPRARMTVPRPRRSLRRTRRRGPSKARIFSSGVQGAAPRRARNERVDSRRDGRPGRRDAELPDADVAFAEHLRDRDRRASAEIAGRRRVRLE